ncbi:MAG: hypothetical protein JW725_04045 [Candidatus Babeliaceae bacterium]|nr:hypothetical protein [Candidatus Babeliaceae bacterium]
MSNVHTPQTTLRKIETNQSQPPMKELPNTYQKQTTEGTRAVSMLHPEAAHAIDGQHAAAR